MCCVKIHIRYSALLWEYHVCLVHRLFTVRTSELVTIWCWTSSCRACVYMHMHVPAGREVRKVRIPTDGVHDAVRAHAWLCGGEAGRTAGSTPACLKRDGQGSQGNVDVWISKCKCWAETLESELPAMSRRLTIALVPVSYTGALPGPGVRGQHGAGQDVRVQLPRHHRGARVHAPHSPPHGCVHGPVYLCAGACALVPGKVHVPWCLLLCALLCQPNACACMPCKQCGMCMCASV